MSNAGRREIDALQVVQSIYRLHDAGDVKGLREVLHKDVVWDAAESYPYRSAQGPWRGREAAMRNVVDAINEEWIGFTTHLEDLIEVGDRIIVLGRYRGRYRATGEAIDAQVCAIYTVENGVVTRFQQYTDTAQFRAAMGCSFPSARSMFASPGE